MKRILMVVLTVVLALSLAVTAYAGELKVGSKEAGAEAYADGAAAVQSSAYINIGSVDFVDGTFKFHLTDLKVTYSLAPTSSSSPVAINTDYAKWYAETGGDGIVFTFSNDRTKWVPYLGSLKPAGKISTDDNVYRTKWLVTGSGKIAGLSTNFNLYETQGGIKDMNLSAAATFGSAKIAGFVGDFDGYDYYGCDVTFTDVLSDGDLWAGLYSNKNTPDNGLAYRVELVGMKAGNVTVDASYRFGNAYVRQAASWKDGNVPAANTKQFYAKAVLGLTIFDLENTLTGEFTRDLTPETNKIDITDQFSINETISGVKLVGKFGNGQTDNFSAEATIAPGVSGLTLYGKVGKNLEGTDTAVQLDGEAVYVLGSATLRGGLTYKSGLNRYYAYGQSSAKYGTLDTTIAGIYYKKDIGKTSEIAYTRAYASATTDLNEYLTDVGAKFLYSKNGAADAKTIAAFGGKYAVSADTSLEASYLFKNAAAGTSHFYVALTKTVGSATFQLSYGGSKKYKAADDADVDKPGFKEFVTKGNVPWRELLGTDDAVQSRIKASVKVPF